MEKEIWTIEINIDDDFASACAYHIDTYMRTSARNLRAACEKHITDRWALVGLAYGIDEANELANRARLELCKMHGREPYGIGFDD